MRIVIIIIDTVYVKCQNKRLGNVNIFCLNLLCSYQTKMDNNTHNISVCRTCLASNTDLQDIFETKVADMLNACSILQVCILSKRIL